MFHHSNTAPTLLRDFLRSFSFLLKVDYYHFFTTFVLMLKKYVAIFAMTLAWTILFGHSIIPHNHHDVRELPGHHFMSDEHHNGNDNHNKLVEAFAHFFHGADGITIIDSKVSIDKTVKESIFFGVIFTLTYFIDQPESQELFFSPPDPVCQSPLIISPALRGPPVLIG